jgi:hypothetical protein
MRHTWHYVAPGRRCPACSWKRHEPPIWDDAKVSTVGYWYSDA